jgi:hypothetical protein
MGDWATSFWDPKEVIAIMMINRSRNIALPTTTEFKHRTREMATYLTCFQRMIISNFSQATRQQILFCFSK